MMCIDLGIGKDPTVEVDSEIIPLPNIGEACLEKMIEWCTQHYLDPPPPPVLEGEEDLAMFNDEIPEWDQEFLKMEDSVLFDLILVCVFSVLNILLWIIHLPCYRYGSFISLFTIEKNCSFLHL